MIDKKIVFSLLAMVYMLGCDAEKNVQDAVNDAKEFVKNETHIAEDGRDENLTESIQALLDVHNSARSELAAGIGNLKWSDTIARDAQTYADILASSGAFGHDPRNDPKDKSQRYENGIYGENLYANSGGATFTQAAQAWVDEKQYYTYGKVGVDKTCQEGIDAYGNEIMCGHYTQVIWKDTTLVGCAKSRYTTGSFRGGEVVVCKYQTPGNYIGQTPYTIK